MQKNNAWQVALRLLARREYASFELTRKLIARGFFRKEVEGALLSCQMKGFQSDERYVAQLCRARVAQGYGPCKIAQELKSVAIDESAMQHYFFDEPVDWHQVARGILKKNAWRFDVDNTAKQHRFLMSRGFPFDVIQVVLREIITYENG